MCEGADTVGVISQASLKTTQNNAEGKHRCVLNIYIWGIATTGIVLDMGNPFQYKKNLIIVDVITI